MDLNSHINRYGNPDALIDSQDSKKYAVWNYKEILKFNNHGFYVNNTAVTGNPLDVLQSKIDDWCKREGSIKALGFISYNFNKFLYPHLSLNRLHSDLPYIWFARPDRLKEYSSSEDCDISSRDNLVMKSDFIDFNSYSSKISDIKKELKNGNTYQINLTSAKKFKALKNPFQTYLAIRRTAKPKYGYYINTGKHTVLSFSPERFVKVQNNVIESWPMKGTRGRSSNKEKDIELYKQLKNSKKDFSEHLMIVDLLRNDIGKIAKNKTVKVNPIFKIDSFPTVHQMVSRVFGKIEDNKKFIDVIKAMFPSGSVTGAPKESSMEIIDKIEDSYRGMYTGSIGHFMDSNDYDFNIAIRTLVANNKCSIYHAGGGIVWDSNTKEEYDEMHIKSRIIEK